MKKIVAIALLTIATITGCSKVEVSKNLEDFYLKSMIEQTEDISLKDAKKSLKNFEYDYKLEEYSKQYSKEEIEKFEKELGEKFEMPDMSYTTFSDKDSSIEITFDETNKKMIGNSYTKNKDNVEKKIYTISDRYSLNIYGNNTKYIEETINRLNLSKDTKEVVGLYFELVNNMENNKDITIKDIQETLNTKYEKRNEELLGEKYYIYDFRMKDGDSYIEVDIDNEEIVKIAISIGISDYTNYLINLSASNEDLLRQTKGFNLDMNIYSILNDKMFDKPQSEIKKAYKPIGKELFEFAYRDGKLKYYTDEYDENKTDIIEGRYNKEEKAYVVIPNEARVVSESLYGIDDKAVTMNLKKDEKIDIEINTEKEIGKQIGITLIDLSNNKVIFKEEIEAKSKNIISTEKVDKDGEYKLVFGIDNMDNYNIKVSAIKTNK